MVIYDATITPDNTTVGKTVMASVTIEPVSYVVSSDGKRLISSNGKQLVAPDD